MSGLNVKSNALEAGYTALNKASEEIAAILRTLDEEVGTLRSKWSGDASDAYDLAQEQWTTSLTAMRDMLSAHAASLDAIDQRYREAGHKIGKIWS